MSGDLRDVRPLTGILMGGGFLLAGLAIVFVAVGWIRVDPASVHAPPWLLGLVICAGMAAVAGWIAFGPGERAFSGSVGVGGVGVSGSGGGATFGRWVFGFGAVLTGAMAVWGLLYGIRRLAGRGRDPGPDRSP